MQFPQIIKIKVMNMTDSKIKINYATDQFTVYTVEDEEHILIKGDRINYPFQDYIARDQSVEYSLSLPTQLWQTSGAASQGESDPNSYKNFWKGENSMQLVKDRIKMIKVVLGGEKTVIMKPVPE